MEREIQNFPNASLSPCKRIFPFCENKKKGELIRESLENCAKKRQFNEARTLLFFQINTLGFWDSTMED